MDDRKNECVKFNEMKSHYILILCVHSIGLTTNNYNECRENQTDDMSPFNYSLLFSFFLTVCSRQE